MNRAFLAVGIAFLALGSTFSFADGGTWPVWIAVGTAFLALGIATPDRAGEGGDGGNGDERDPGEPTGSEGDPNL